MSTSDWYYPCVQSDRERGTSENWYNQKQVCRGRLEREEYSLVLPISPEIHKKETVETGSTRNECAAKGTRGRISGYY